jgi:hypothetical protein
MKIFFSPAACTPAAAQMAAGFLRVPTGINTPARWSVLIV